MGKDTVKDRARRVGILLGSVQASGYLTHPVRKLPAGDRGDLFVLADEDQGATILWSRITSNVSAVGWWAPDRSAEPFSPALDGCHHLHDNGAHTVLDRVRLERLR